MAYSELVKNFELVRDYMRQFYVYGFKRREEYDKKSTRSYDNERRRIESWLGDYMSFRLTEDGKIVFLSVDSRTVSTNPLYKAFKAKSFTSGDITLHFYLMDLLADGTERSVTEIMDRLSADYFSRFENVPELDVSTVRKKLKEYEELGLIKSRKAGRELLWSRNESSVPLTAWADALAFFSEADPLGVVGSTLLDRLPTQPDCFRFKHHYLLDVLNAQIVEGLAEAISEKRCVDLTIHSPRRQTPTSPRVFPMKIFVSTQSGRQHLLAYHYRFRKPMFFRLDTIRLVEPGPVESSAETYYAYYEALRQNLWGVSTGEAFTMDHVELILH